MSIISERSIRPVDARGAKSIQEMQRDRALRALREMPEYRFRLTEIGGENAVHVSTINNPAGYAVFADRCTCRDHEQVGHLVTCKHRIAVEHWFASGLELEIEAPQPEPQPSSVEDWAASLPEPALVVTYAAPSPVVRVSREQFCRDWEVD